MFYCEKSHLNLGELFRQTLNSTAQKMKFSIEDCFGKRDQTRSFLWINPLVAGVH